MSTYTRNPYKGVPDTLTQMAGLAREAQTDSVVREWAEDRVKGLGPNDPLSELAALNYAMARHVRYTADPLNAEMVRHPQITLQRGHGDCDDMATALRTMVSGTMRSVGIQAEFCAVGISGNEPEHVFVRARLPDGNWVVLDPVAGPSVREMLPRIKTVQTR